MTTNPCDSNPSRKKERTKEIFTDEKLTWKYASGRPGRCRRGKILHALPTRSASSSSFLLSFFFLFSLLFVNRFTIAIECSCTGTHSDFNCLPQTFFSYSTVRVQVASDLIIFKRMVLEWLVRWRWLSRIPRNRKKPFLIFITFVQYVVSAYKSRKSFQRDNMWNLWNDCSLLSHFK